MGNLADLRKPRGILITVAAILFFISAIIGIVSLSGVWISNERTNGTLQCKVNSTLTSLCRSEQVGNIISGTCITKAGACNESSTYPKEQCTYLQESDFLKKMILVSLAVSLLAALTLGLGFFSSKGFVCLIAALLGAISVGLIGWSLSKWEKSLDNIVPYFEVLRYAENTLKKGPAYALCIVTAAVSGISCILSVAAFFFR